MSTPLCRYTGLPLESCKCSRGCETNQITTDEWIQPVRKGYRMACCDCGLVHSMDFRIVTRGKRRSIQFRARREEA